MNEQPQHVGQYETFLDWHDRCMRIVQAALRSDIAVARLCLEVLSERLELAKPTGAQ